MIKILENNLDIEINKFNKEIKKTNLYMIDVKKESNKDKIITNISIKEFNNNKLYKIKLIIPKNSKENIILKYIYEDEEFSFNNIGNKNDQNLKEQIEKLFFIIEECISYYEMSELKNKLITEFNKKQINLIKDSNKINSNNNLEKKLDLYTELSIKKGTLLIRWDYTPNKKIKLIYKKNKTLKFGGLSCAIDYLFFSSNLQRDLKKI
jgi:hypothetical protein